MKAFIKVSTDGTGVYGWDIAYLSHTKFYQKGKMIAKLFTISLHVLMYMATKPFFSIVHKSTLKPLSTDGTGILNKLRSSLSHTCQFLY